MEQLQNFKYFRSNSLFCSMVSWALHSEFFSDLFPLRYHCQSAYLKSWNNSKISSISGTSLFREMHCYTWIIVDLFSLLLLLLLFLRRLSRFLIDRRRHVDHYRRHHHDHHRYLHRHRYDHQQHNRITNTIDVTTTTTHITNTTNSTTNFTITTTPTTNIIIATTITTTIIKTSTSDFNGQDAGKYQAPKTYHCAMDGRRTLSSFTVNTISSSPFFSAIYIHSEIHLGPIQKATMVPFTAAATPKSLFKPLPETGP